MPLSHPLDISFAVVLIAQLVTAAQLPYNPTHILVSAQNPKQAYIIRQPSSSSQWELGTLDLSRVQTSGLSVSILQPTLPFLPSSSSQPFSPSIDNNGTISIYTGDCAQDATSAQLWTFSTTGSKSWSQLQADSIASGVLSPQYLSTSISFSNITSGSMKDSKIYIFGGMCPLSRTSDDSWISSASYSSSMMDIAFSPSQESYNYVETLGTAQNVPVSQAGHTLTPLQPTFSQKPDGTQAQQQNFVLLGGHTNAAFLNLSQAAFFSLPQESWNYFSVPSKSGALPIDPRSGHTAVLSADGHQIVVFGGWVGDVNTPASPQLAVLNIADGYGGSGSWQWSTPSSTGSGPPSNGGLYGHASMMLPDNVMLVTGGYSMIPSTSRFKRDTTSQNSNTATYLYNLTSNTWISEYNAPASAFHQPVSTPNKGLSVPAQAGLGVGISLGVLLFFVALFTWLWHKRRERWRKEQREDELRDAQGYVSDEWGSGDYGTRPDEFTEKSSFRYYTPAVPQQGHLSAGRQQQSHTTMNQVAERNGSNLHSQQRVTRKNVGTRGAYAYEKSVGKRDTIHTISENPEDDQDGRNKRGKEPMPPHEDDANGPTRSITSTKNPFIDPLGSNPVNSRPGSGSTNNSPEERESEIQSWVSGWKRAGEELLGPADHDGRVSPSKSDRTMSSLSSVSAISSRSGVGSSSGVTNLVRSLSTRSAQLLKLSAFNSTAGASIPGSPVSSISPTTPTIKTTSNIFHASDTPSFAKLQADSEVLFGKSPKHAKRGTDPATTHATSNRKIYPTISPGGMFGSMRRAIGMGTYTPNPGRSTSLTATSTRDFTNSRLSSSPTIDMGRSTSASVTPLGGAIPRRSASDAAFWKTKRGSKDWGADVDFHGGLGKAESTVGGFDEEEEWDVEGMAQNRVVQVMFTVPRERLRVVNADASDGESIRSGIINNGF